MEQVLEAAAGAGASAAFYMLLRLPWEVDPVFQQWLSAHYPDRALRVMARLRDMRGGKNYQSAFGERFEGTGIWARLLHQRFTKACQRLGLNRDRIALTSQHFDPVRLSGQPSIF